MYDFSVKKEKACILGVGLSLRRRKARIWMVTCRFELSKAPLTHKALQVFQYCLLLFFPLSSFFLFVFIFNWFHSVTRCVFNIHIPSNRSSINTNGGGWTTCRLATKRVRDSWAVCRLFRMYRFCFFGKPCSSVQHHKDWEVAPYLGTPVAFRWTRSRL